MKNTLWITWALIFTPFFLTSCGAKRRSSSLNTQNQQAKAQSTQPSAPSRPNLIKGKILSVTEAAGLVGWVCEENSASIDLRVVAGDTAVQGTPGLVSGQSDTEADTQCNGIGLVYRFTLPFSYLRSHAGALVSVRAIPNNSPQTQTVLSDSNLYRVPTATTAPNNPSDSSSSTPATSSSSSASSNSSTAPATTPAPPAPPTTVIPVTPVEPRSYTVTAVNNPTAGGSGIASATVSSGATLVLHANANPGYVFQNWSNCPNPDGSSCRVVATSNLTVTANFLPQVCSPNAIERASCPIVNGAGLQSRTCSSDGLNAGTFGACVLQSCQAGYLLRNGACVSPGPTDPAMREPGKTVSPDPRGIFDGRTGTQEFLGGWACQTDLRNSLFVRVYVGTSLANKKFVGQFIADKPEGTGVTGTCSTVAPPGTKYRGSRRFRIPLSAFSPADSGKRVFVFGVRHGSTVEREIRIAGHKGYTDRLP